MSAPAITAEAEAPRPGIPPALALGAAVFAMSWAGPLIRFSEAPALVISAWRLTFSVAFIALLLAARGGVAQLRRLTAGDSWLLLGAGLLLAAHFWSWIASIGLTTISSSVVLVSMQPLFVALLSATFLGERPTPRQWSGIAVAVVGAAIIGWGDFGHGAPALLGDLLALAGAVFVSGYYVIGRGVRQRLELRAYIFVVYGIAGAALLAVAALLPSVRLTGYATQDWLVFLALAAGPMMIGHTGVNYALRYVRAYLANLVVLAEPVGSTLIAWLLPAIHEVPGAQTLVGATLILAGIGIGSGRRR